MVVAVRVSTPAKLTKQPHQGNDYLELDANVVPPVYHLISSIKMKVYRVSGSENEAVLSVACYYEEEASVRVEGETTSHIKHRSATHVHSTPQTDFHVAERVPTGVYDAIGDVQKRGADSDVSTVFVVHQTLIRVQPPEVQTISKTTDSQVCQNRKEHLHTEHGEAYENSTRGENP